MTLPARWSHALAAIMLAFAVTISVPAKAQQLDPAYVDVVAAINEGIAKEAGVEATFAVIRRGYESDPVFAEAEARSPGFLDDLMAEFRPIFLDRSDRLDKILTARIAALFARHLTVGEAKELAAFYRSDVMKRFNDRASRAYSPEHQLGDLTQDEEVSGDDVASDAKDATNAAVRSTPAEDLLEIRRRTAALSSRQKIAVIGPRMAAIRAEIENAPTTAEEDALIDAAIKRTLDKHFPNGF